MSKDKSKSKKNETKKSDTNGNGVPLEKGKDSSKSPAEKSDAQNGHTGRSSSEAGKGDKLRRGISQDEWGEKWEKIFRLKGENNRTKKL